MTVKKINFLLEAKGIKSTSLRQDILLILLNSQKPLGAYDILNILKKKRPNAEPPTVYRVLDFLIENKIIHRIDTQNTYVCCEHLTDTHSPHNTILLLCNHCSKSFEYKDKNIFDSLTVFATQNRLHLDDGLIKINGLCARCISNQ
jgi:Fur family zinc uptake transcriptional regulator